MARVQKSPPGQSPPTGPKTTSLAKTGANRRTVSRANGQANQARQRKAKRAVQLIEPDRSEAERHLNILDPTATSFTFQTFDDAGDRKAKNLARILIGSLDRHWNALVDLNRRGAGVYVAVNETDGRGRKAKNIIRVRAQFNDLDGAPIEPVTKSEWPPHLVIESSPKKFHTYQLATGIALNQFTDIQDMLAARFNGDARVRDLPRVLRLAGFFHQKGAPFMSRIVSTRDAPPYTAADFTGTKTDSFTDYGNQTTTQPIDVEQKLADMEYHDRENGINNTELSVIAALLNRAAPIDEVKLDAAIKKVLAAVAATPGTKNFSWKKEYAIVRDMGVRWIRKRPEIADRGWLKKNLPKLAAAVEHEEKTAAAKLPVIEPHDFWGAFEPLPLSRGLLPDLVERYAFAFSELMGSDAAAFAMCVLTIAGAAIPDTIKIQPKQHDPGWLEAARLWPAFVGDVSVRKSPILRETLRPVRTIVKMLAQRFAQEKREFDALSNEDKRGIEPPQLQHFTLEDATIEGVQDVMVGSDSCGLLSIQDELSGWLGAMDRYNSSGGANRAFWLKSWNGDSYTVTRARKGRGTFHIPNIGVSMIGGIQPDVIRKIARETYDDGLIQRLLPIMLPAGEVGRDVPITSGVSEEYAALIARLYKLRPEEQEQRDFFETSARVKFSPAAQAIQHQCMHEHNKLVKTFATVNKKLASHIGKYDGYFARLCLIWHYIENKEPSEFISESVARRVADFMHGFLLHHAVTFYGGTLNLTENYEELSDIAGYILAHRSGRLTTRDLARGNRTMRKLARRDTDQVFEMLESFGWLTRTPGKRAGDPPFWIVNPLCHERFAERAKLEAIERAEAKGTIEKLLKKR